jgi:hypothetical protein
MKQLFFFYFISAFTLSSCKRSADPETNKDQNDLYQRFNGTYSIISSLADQAIDLNFDGVASVQLKDELSDLRDCQLEIRILKGSSSNLFSEFWPEAFFSGLGGNAPASYDSTVMLNYARQSVTRTFTFTTDLNKILLDPDDASIDAQLHTRPTTVNILSGDIIEVIKTKRFYTDLGWKEMRVFTQYQRITM